MTSNGTGDRDTEPRGPGDAEVDVVDGDAVVPDAADAPDKDDLKPDAPPPGAPAEGDLDKTSAVDPPVPAHGEMASPEQIREATRAAEEEDAED
jgi:hypothetical protein